MMVTQLMRSNLRLLLKWRLVSTQSGIISLTKKKWSPLSKSLSFLAVNIEPIKICFNRLPATHTSASTKMPGVIL